MSKERRVESEHLDRFWDEVVGGESTSPADLDLDPTRLETVRRFHALGGAPPPASARERVWRGLMAEHVSAQASPSQTQETTMDAFVLQRCPQTTALDGRTASSARQTPVRLRRTRRLLPLLELAAAALLLFALFGTLFAGDQLRPWLAGIRRDPAPPNVPVARGNAARTGELPGPGPNGTPAELWRVPTGCCAPPAPTLFDDTIFVGTSANDLFAVEAATGAVKWRYAAQGEVGGSPAIADGVVYVGDAAGNLAAIDAATGAERWRVAVAVPLFGTATLYGAAPVAVDGVVYLVSGAGATPPAVVDGVVYAGGDGFASRGPLFAHAFDAATGRELWSHNLIRNGVFALDAETGTEVWHFPTPNSVYHSAPAVADGIVYVGGKDRHLYAVDALTGRERWRVQTGGPIYASPAVASGVVYVASDDGSFYSLDAATGATRWQAALGAKGRSSAVVVGAEVYLVAGGKLHVLDAVTGAPRWNIAVGDAESSPAVAGGVVYVGWGDKAAQTGALVALGER